MRGPPHTVLRRATARVQPSRRGGQGRAGGGDNAPAALRGKVREMLFLPPKALRQLQNGVIQKIDLIMDTAAIRGRWVGVSAQDGTESIVCLPGVECDSTRPAIRVAFDTRTVRAVYQRQ